MTPETKESSAINQNTSPAGEMMDEVLYALSAEDVPYEAKEFVRKMFKDCCLMREDLEWFVSRVENGEVRSRRTYERFKDHLSQTSPYPKTNA